MGGASGPAIAMGLDFLSGTLDPRVTFTRGTTGTFVGSNGLIQTAAINAPRFDYDPATLAPKGLLIEEQRVNSVIYSDELDNGAWFKDHIAITVNAATAPNGANAADKAIPNNGEDLTAITHGVVRQNVNHSAGATLTFSVFAKQAEFNRIELYFSEGTGTTNLARVRYSLVDGSIVTAPTVEGTFTNASSTSTSFGNGWYRFTLTFTTAGISVVGRARIAIRDSVTTVGNGTSGILVWGAQVETGAFATSYIPTVASTVTRSADVATMTGTNFSSWYNQTEGSFVSQFSFFAAADTANTKVFAAASDGTTSNRISGNLNASSIAFGTVSAGGAIQANMNTGGAVTNNTVTKVSLAYKLNDFGAVLNGGTVVTDVSGTVPTVNQLGIGTLGAFSALNGHIRSIAYYNTRLPDATLRTLTA